MWRNSHFSDSWVFTHWNHPCKNYVDSWRVYIIMKIALFFTNETNITIFLLPSNTAINTLNISSISRQGLTTETVTFPHSQSGSILLFDSLPKKHKGNHSPGLLRFLSPPILFSSSISINATILGFNLGIEFSSVSEFSQQQNGLNCWCCWLYSVPAFTFQSPSWNAHLSIFPSAERIFPLEMLEWHCGVGKTN